MPDDDRGPLRAEQGRIETLLACDGARLFALGRRADRERAERAGVEWTPDLGDPEFTKNLRTLLLLGVAAAALCERTGAPEAELAERIALPRDRPLTLESLLAHRFAVEQLLIARGDEQYLRMRAAGVYDEGEGTYVRWRGMFGGPPPLLDPAAKGDRTEATRLMLERLMAAKEAQDLPLRARRELKARAVRLIMPLILVATACSRSRSRWSPTTSRPSCSRAPPGWPAPRSAAWSSCATRSRAARTCASSSRSTPGSC